MFPVFVEAGGCLLMGMMTYLCEDSALNVAAYHIYSCVAQILRFVKVVYKIAIVIHVSRIC